MRQKNVFIDNNADKNIKGIYRKKNLFEWSGKESVTLKKVIIPQKHVFEPLNIFLSFSASICTRIRL